MSVENPKTIDFVSLNTLPGAVLLVVSDHLEWSNTMTHQFQLQEKLNSYLAFIESGELVTKFPDAKEKPVHIRIVFEHEPDASGLQFLAKVRQAIEAGGFSFAYQVGIEKSPQNTVH